MRDLLGNRKDGRVKGSTTGVDLFGVGGDGSPETETSVVREGRRCTGLNGEDIGEFYGRTEGDGSQGRGPGGLSVHPRTPSYRVRGQASRQ